MQKKKINLSVALAVYNEENNLSDCLSSVVDIADEIIVVDGGSTDRTASIAKEFGATILQATNPPMFHINKQKALSICRGTWILQLDADEVTTKELKDEIIETIHDKGLRRVGYYIPRKNYFWGHFMRKGGQYPDYVIRLVKRGKAHFPCKSVHEQMAVDGDVGHLKHALLHFSYRTRKDYWKKSDAYTTLSALEMQKQHIGKNLPTWFLYMLIKPIKTFVSIFIRHKGFVDGVWGFEFALYSGLHYSRAWAKYLALH